MAHEFVKYLKGFTPKEFLIKEGDDDHDFFCLLEGIVGIWKGNPEEPDKLVRVGEISEKGAYFGEMSYFLHEKRTASIIAENDTKVLQFPGDMLPKLIMKQPQLGIKICTALADRLKGTTVKTEEVAMQRDEVRGDANAQLMHAKEAYKKSFMLLTAIQAQFQNPLLKQVIEYMSKENLLKGGRKQKADDEFTHDLPEKLAELVRKAYPE